MTKFLSNKSTAWLILVLLALTWGSSFILMKKGLLAYPPEQMAAIRIAISFLSLAIIVLKDFKKLDKKYYKPLIITGLCGNGIPAFLFAFAQTVVSSSMAGILNSLTTAFTLVIGVVFFKANKSWLRTLGVFLGLAGAVAMVYLSSQQGIGNLSIYALMIVVATIGYAISVNVIRYKLRDLPSLQITAFAFSVVGLPSILYLFTTDCLDIFINHPMGRISFLYIALLGILGTATAVILFNHLIKISGAVFATTVTYLIPIVALIWGFVDGESPGYVQLISLGIILTGVYLIHKEKE
ncbi:MAG: DMT family transporter [Bacteroidia bacterium]|nr:DMT family transporter [Bacteroidia bacterium]